MSDTEAMQAESESVKEIKEEPVEQPNPELTVEGMPRRYQRRNFILLLMQSGIFCLGWAMMGVIRTPYLNWLQVKESTIGIIGSLSFLALIGQFFSPWLSKKFHRKKWLQFCLGLPYLWSDLAVGIGILVAMYTGNYAWLLPFTIICFMTWPFFGGWSVPYLEYKANCISKERIGVFLGISQVVGPLMGLVGSTVMTWLMFKFGVPFRYALAFILAFILAQVSVVATLFAHETPVSVPVPKEPFWQPAVDAFTKDRVFQRLLLLGFFGFGILTFNLAFIPLFALRSFGLADWVAGGYFTTLMGAQMIGGLIAAWLGQKIGYASTLKITFVVFLISIVPLVVPKIGEGKADIYHGSWALNDGQIANMETALSTGDDFAFRVVGQSVSLSEMGSIENVQIQFNRAVDAATFSIYDVKIKDPDGRLIELSEVAATDDSAIQWQAVPKEPLSKVGSYSIAVHPYILDTDGNALDQNGNGKTGIDQWRFFIQAVPYGIAYTMLGTCIMSLMFILAPDNRRAGYFSATSIMQMFVPGVASLLAGFCFVPGRYQLVFGVVLVVFIPITLLSFWLVKPLAAREHEERAMNNVKQ